MQKSADRLLELASEVLRSRFTFAKDDHLALMAVCFAARQLEYLKAVCSLVEAGHSNAAGVIARSMLEGACLLLLAAKHPDTIPARWFAYAVVENVEILEKRESEGEAVDPALREHVEDQIKAYGPQFYTRKAMDRARQRKPLPSKPFHANWYAGRVRDVFAKVGAETLYKWTYWETSRLVHWTIGGLEKDLRRDGARFEYIKDSPAMDGTALAAGFRSLFESLSLLDLHFRLGFRDRLDALHQGHIAIHKT